MKKWQKWMSGLAVLCALAIGLSSAWAQPGGEGRVRGERGARGERGERMAEGRQRGERGVADREMGDQMRQRRQQRWQQALGLNDDELAVVEPMIEKVQELARQTRGGAMMMAARRGAAEEDAAVSPVAQATRELRTLINREDATAEQMQAQLAVLRAARELGAAELAQAQTELREVLTQRQEAQLVLMGVLD